jgi:DNA-binding response OmpR family regulator
MDTHTQSPIPSNPQVNTHDRAANSRIKLEPVLFIDDVGAQTIIGIPLRRHGLEVVKAHTIKDAYAVLNTQAVSMVLLGTLTPEALEFVELLRIGEHAHLPVMLLPKEGDDSMLAYFQQAGADDYVYKPVHHDELSEKIYTLVNR